MIDFASATGKKLWVPTEGNPFAPGPFLELFVCDVIRRRDKGEAWILPEVEMLILQMVHVWDPTIRQHVWWELTAWQEGAVWQAALCRVLNDEDLLPVVNPAREGIFTLDELGGSGMVPAMAGQVPFELLWEGSGDIGVIDRGRSIEVHLADYHQAGYNRSLPASKQDGPDYRGYVWVDNLGNTNVSFGRLLEDASAIEVVG